MPAKSKSQQRLFQMALAVRTGALPRSKVNDSVLKIVDGDMTDKQIEDFTVLNEQLLFNEVGMYSLRDYIIEAKGGKIFDKIIVFDIDDTLLRANSSDIKLYKRVNNGPEQALSTLEFAVDPDKDKPGVEYDYREFRDPEKVYNSIVHGTFLMKNLKLMDKYINQGWAFCFLTARALENVITKALRKAIRYRNSNGKLKKLGIFFRVKDSAAVNDLKKMYPGHDDGEKKANVLRQLCSKYSKVKFVDDDDRNLQAAEQLNLPNLEIIKSLE